MGNVHTQSESITGLGYSGLKMGMLYNELSYSDLLHNRWQQDTSGHSQSV